MVDGSAFDRWLEHQFRAMALPGMTAALIHAGTIQSLPAFGYADLYARIPVTPETPFLLSSLTKPLSAIVMLRLVAQGVLDLDSPMRHLYRDYDVFCDRMKRYARDGVEPVELFRNYNGNEYNITLRHHITHTSQGVPGTRFFYNGFLFGIVARAVEGALGRPYVHVFCDQLIHLLGLENTSPHTSGVPILNVQQPIARSYYRRSNGTYYRSEFPEVAFSASAGLIGSVADLAQIDLALDSGELLAPPQRTQLWTPYRLKNERNSPYALGWYVQPYQDVTLYWHTGWWDASSSAIYLKIPERQLTLILLANSDGLRWESENDQLDISESPLIRAFLERFL